jgi:hypothetical protein
VSLGKPDLDGRCTEVEVVVMKVEAERKTEFEIDTQ